MTPGALTDTVVRDCAAAGVKRDWMYRAGGRRAVTSDAVKFCVSNGIPVIPGECPMIFSPNGAWFHRLHSLLKRISGSYPA